MGIKILPVSTILAWQQEASDIDSSRYMAMIMGTRQSYVSSNDGYLDPFY